MIMIKCTNSCLHLIRFNNKISSILKMSHIYFNLYLIAIKNIHESIFTHLLFYSCSKCYYYIVCDLF